MKKLFQGTKVLLTVADNRVATLTLSDPAKMNAMDVTMGKEFVQAVEAIQASASSINSLVLRGAGTAFSAGGDMEFLMARGKDTPINNAKIMRDFYSRFLSIRSVHCPTIAAINGAAVGAGLCVALACDMRVTTKSARMGVTFASLGLHPGMGCTHFLPLTVGQQQAARLISTGELITGQEAEKIGMVLNAVDGDAEACVAYALSLAEKIASAGPLAVQGAIKSLRMKQDTGLEQALQREADAQSQTYASQDYQTGLKATQEKKKPSFSGL
jgi:enoyl-CoA hydratase